MDDIRNISDISKSGFIIQVLEAKHLTQMLIVKKSQLETLFSLTKGTEGVLTLPESRIRDAFLKPLLAVTQTYLEDKTKIYMTYCFKNEDGIPKLKDGDKYEFAKDVIEPVNEELATLLDETIELEIPEKLKEILEKSEYKPKVGEAEIIDEILSKL